MLIELDRSLVPLLQRDPSFQNPVATALDALGMGRRAGNHLIYAERDVLEELLAFSQCFSPATTAILKHAFNRYAEKGAFAEQLNVRVSVGAYPQAAISNTTTPGRYLIEIPVERLDLAFVQKTFLLVENLVDASFYRFVAESRGQGGGVTFDFEAYPGGGNTTAEAYKHIATLNRLCLCIVDSDVRYPNGPKGNTAKAVLAAANQVKSPLLTHYVLPVCSVENLIPFETLKESMEGDFAQVRRVEALAPLYKEEVWPFLQLKKGVRCSDAVGNKTNAERFWFEVIGDATTDFPCTSKPLEVPCSSKAPCSTFVYDSLGPNTLTATLKYLGTQKKFVGEVAVESSKKAWNEIADLVTAWCCAGSPMFAG